MFWYITDTFLSIQIWPLIWCIHWKGWIWWSNDNCL